MMIKKPETFEEFKKELAKRAIEGQYTYNGLCVAFDDSPIRELWDSMQPQCQHEFEPAYDEITELPAGKIRCPGDFTCNEQIAMLNAAKEHKKIYRGHVCHKCGKAVNMEGKR